MCVLLKRPAEDPLSTARRADYNAVQYRGPTIK